MVLRQTSALVADLAKTVAVYDSSEFMHFENWLERALKSSSLTTVLIRAFHISVDFYQDEICVRRSSIQ